MLDNKKDQPSGFLSTYSGGVTSKSSPRASLFSRQLRNTSSSLCTNVVTSPMALFISFQAALVASGFDERLWSLIKESELLAGALFPYGLFLRHSLQAFPSAALEVMNSVEGFVVEGTDERLVPQIYKALEVMFGFKPVISSAQFLKAFNPCGKSKFAGHMIQTCGSFHALMKRKDMQIMNDAREKQQQHQTQLLSQHQSALQIKMSASPRHNGQLVIMPPGDINERDAQKFEAELSVAKEEIFATGDDYKMPDHRSLEGRHHRQHQSSSNYAIGPPHRAGPAEQLDRSEVGGGGGCGALSSVNSSLLDVTNRSVRVGTTAGIPIKIGGKLEMRCVTSPPFRSNTSMATPMLLKKQRASGDVVLVDQNLCQKGGGNIMVRRPDRFGQYSGGDISTAPSTHFSGMSSTIYTRHGGGADVAPPSSTTDCCPNGELLDAMVSTSQQTASNEAKGCCARHALHSIRHHDRNVNKNRLELSKLELQHSILNSQKRTALNREVGGFRL